MLKSMIVMPTTVVLLLLVCSLSANVNVVSGTGERENGGLFREYKEDLNEFLTSEEVDRLVYGNDDSVISEKLKNMPDMSMSPPGHSGHQLPVPTMDPALDAIVHGPLIKKLPPQRNNFMNMMKTAARMLTNRNTPSRSPRQRVPLPQYRARPSTLTSSQPDQLEVAFKRIEIIAARAGLNMSSMPRRTQMQVIRKLAGKLPPRMSQLMKTTLDHNSQKLYDYLPEPSRDPLVEDSPDFLSQFMEGAKVSMDGAEYSIMPDHHTTTTTFEYSEPTHSISSGGDFSFSGHEPGEIITHHTVSDPSHHHESGDVMITDHHPGTDYSIPSYDSHSSSNVNVNGGNGNGNGHVSPSTSPFGFSAPPPSYETHPAGFGSINPSASSDGSSSSSSNSASSNTVVDLKPIAAPLIGETHEIYAQASENLPTIISPNSHKNPSPLRSNKALKVTSIKNVTPSTFTTVTSSSSSSSSTSGGSQPVIRVSMPTKDEIKINKPIRVSIITKDNVTNISPYTVDSQPIFTQDESKEVRAQVQEIVKTSGEEKDKETTTSSSTHVNIPKTDSSADTLKPTTPENTIIFNPLGGGSLSSDEAPIPHKFIPMPVSSEDTKTTTASITKPSNPPPGLLLKEVEDDYGLDSLGLGLNDEEDQDLTSSELIAELKKYNSDYANSLEIDYPLAPHPLEYPDHPDHPDNSDPVPSTATATTLASPRPTPPQGQHGPHGQRPHGVRPHIQPHGGPRLPIRPRIRPPPGPGHFGRPGPNGRPMPPRRPPHGHHRPGFRPPLRINEVTVSEIPKTTQKECDYFSEDLCLAVQDYPIEAISEAMTGNEATKLMVKEPAEASWVDGVGKNQEGGYNFKHYYGDGNTNTNKVSSGAAAPGESGSHRHRDFAGEGGFLCPSKVAYGRVKKARSFTTGEWKYIVNYAENSQTLRLEKCLSPGNSCSYVMPHYRTSCSQVYNYNRLLAWDSEKGLHMDIFKVPTCCTCHVQGYYIPGQQQGMTPARRRDIPPKLQFAQQQHRHRQAQQQKQQQQAQQAAQLRREQQLSQQAQASKQAQSKFTDELQELLAQYSSLRERIAKKKNERQSLSYSVSYSNSTKENSKRESSKSLRNSEELAHKLVAGGLKQKVPMQQRLRQRAMIFNLMKRMKKGNTTITKKKLTQILKAAHLKAKPEKNVDPTKSSHFNGTAHKLKTSRAVTLHKLANLLTALSSPNRGNGTLNGTDPISKARVAAITRSARRLLGQRSLQAGEATTGASPSEQAQLRLLKQKQQQLLRLLQSRQGRFSSHETKLDKLKLLLNRSLLKNRRNGTASGKPGLGPLNNKRLQLLHQLQMHSRRKNAQVNRTKQQRLRLGSKKPSKVNYSYHPIMDYFGGKPA